MNTGTSLTVSFFSSQRYIEVQSASTLTQAGQPRIDQSVSERHGARPVGQIGNNEYGVHRMDSSSCNR